MSVAARPRKSGNETLENFLRDAMAILNDSDPGVTNTIDDLRLVNSTKTDNNHSVNITARLNSKNPCNGPLPRVTNSANLGKLSTSTHTNPSSPSVEYDSLEFSPSRRESALALE